MAAPLRTVFFGTPRFAVPTLKKIAERPDVAKILAVITQPDRPAGRGRRITAPDVKVVAEELRLPVFQPEDVNDPASVRQIADLLPDVGVVIAYAQFLGQAILSVPRLGCVNVHSSLLPRHRGAAPIQYAIWKGERETGVTTMRVVRKMDAGPIYLSRSVPIGPETTAGELHDQLADVGAKLLIETLDGLRDGRIAEAPQDEKMATYAPLIRKKEGQINWGEPGEAILRQLRALDPWPGTHAFSSRGLLKVHKARFHPRGDHGPVGLPDDAAPGDTFTETGDLWVRCGDGWLELLEIQPEGGRPMSARQYLNGIQGKSWRFEPEGDE